MYRSLYYLVAGNYQKLPQLSGRRYRVIGDSPPVALDCNPGRPAEAPASLPDSCHPYQRLNLFRWAVPEVHTCITDAQGEPCVLLASGPLYANGSPWPSLAKAWGRATRLKRLGWLIQLTRLWDPCLQEGVATSLLSLENIGVLGWQACIFFLVPDLSAPALAALGSSWRQLSPLDPELEKLIEDLVTGQIDQADHLLDALESLAVVSSSPGRSIAHGATHPGRRENNEDCFACDPEGRYGIVCDGMGGHEGGEVASGLALESLEADLIQLSRQPYTPVQLRRGLADAVYRANQQLLNKNRQQGRSQYRQMGTTVVACCLSGPMLHIAHVGDSRIYLIDKNRCQQLTVDDDVANLEVSLAHTTSNAILQINGSGNLTQALGVVAMASLQPTIQTFVLPDDCLVLLCSDGLCDGDLVERSWQTALLPLLTQSDLAAGADTLIQLALTELGHDNITFVLLKYTAGTDECRRD